ncbi:MAG: hypothetical protein WAS27_04515 [Candidatus Saccharimonadales bacterium]
MTTENPDGRYSLRSEYHQTDTDKLEERHILADTINELMDALVTIGSDIQSFASIDETGSCINRSFRYIEADQPNYIIRESTPYDHEQLHNELIEFDKLLRADEQEKTTLARLQ